MAQRDYRYGSAAAAFALGLAAFIKIQLLTAKSMKPLGEACITYGSVTEFTSKTEYQAYEPLTGFVIFRPLVCIITNFLFGLTTTYPAGLLTWGATMCVALPATMLQLTESSRAGARGMIRYPIVLGILAQMLGISVVFPALWVPSAYFGRGQGGVTPLRVFASCLATPLAFAVLSVLVFLFLNEASYYWTLSAGLVGGPGVALSPLLLWPLSHPDGSSQQAERGQSTLVNAYIFISVVSFAVWWFLLWLAYHTFADFSSFLDAVWMKTTPEVAVMTVDAVVLYFGALLYIAYVSRKALRLAAFLCPLFGPGASIGLALASLEIDREPVCKEKQA